MVLWGVVHLHDVDLDLFGAQHLEVHRADAALAFSARLAETITCCFMRWCARARTSPNMRVLFWLLLRGPMAGRPYLALSVCVLYALLDEGHQILVPGRTPVALGCCAGFDRRAVQPLPESGARRTGVISLRFYRRLERGGDAIHPAIEGAQMRHRSGKLQSRR